MPGRHDHRPRPAAPPSPRRPTRSHLGAARDLPAVRKDLHRLAELVGAFGTFQRALPATGLRANRRRRHRRTGSATLQESITLAGCIHRTPLVAAATTKLMVLGQTPRPTLSPGTHHPCLGSG